ALATTCVIVASVAALELTAVLGLVHWPVLFGRLAGGEGRYGAAFRFDPELGFRRLPGQRWVQPARGDIEVQWTMPASWREPLTFTFDRTGYRNPDGRERADVVLIGDSYVEGWYVSDDDTVARRLEAELHAPVANLGVAGYGTLQQQRVVCGDALERHPRVLVWCFFEGNDLYDDQRFEKYVCPTPGADAAAPGPGTAPPDPDSAAP